MSNKPYIAIAAFCAALVASQTGGAEVASPISPEETLAHFQLDPGLSIELVACEPAVIDPIAIRFDEDGRLWVVEMRDYPHGPPEGQPPLSKIRILSDADGDGRYETSRVFAEELLFPTGLQPWKGGAIVTLAGEVVYLKDTDGDGRADLREVWFRGFTIENPQLRANHPRFGLDNRVYIANGLRGGAVVDPRVAGAKPISISGMDFCFDPRTFAAEAVSGNGQFGMTWDDWGNRFVCNNREPLDQVVLENRYLARNPFLAVPALVAPVAAPGEKSHVFPLTAAWTTSNLHAGQFTAACGVEIFRGDRLGKEYYGNALVCEPTGNLVHREVLAPAGVTFTSRAEPEGREFLATPDAWFRPVNLETGPDGALYVVDMYRAVIEHPQYMPSELQQRPDLRLGDDRGRIYRIARAGTKPAGRASAGASGPATPRLSKGSSAALVELLKHKNSWWRETAARLFYERQDQAAVPALAALAADESHAVAQSAALVVLAGLKGLTNELLEASLRSSHAGVRQQAVLLTEPRLQESAALRRVVLDLALDADARVRFRAALALGGLDSNEAAGALATIALKLPDDVWTRRAVSTLVAERIAPLLTLALAAPQTRTCQLDSGEAALVRELAVMVGSRRNAAEIQALLENVLPSDQPAMNAADEAALLGLAQGLERRGGALVDFLAQNAAPAGAKSRLDAVFDQAVAVAIDPSADESLRGRKIELLKHSRSQNAADALLDLLATSPSQTLRGQAAASLSAATLDKVPPALIAAYAAQTPAVRRAVLDALLVRPPAAQALLTAIESGLIARAELDIARENRLRQHADAAVRERAGKLLKTAVPAERKSVLAEYQAALALAPDARAGKLLFRQHCAACHHIGDVGVDVAPDISDSRVKTPAQLLTDILNPNQAIDNNYVSYTIVTQSGQVHTGVIAAETATSITLRQAENKSVDLLRGDIETVRSNGVSLMPEGFEKHLTQQQMADLIGFVKNWRYLEQAIPGVNAGGGTK